MTHLTRSLGTVLIGAAVLAVPVRSSAQTPEESPAPARNYTVLAGAGNGLGGLGVQAERYFAGDRLSVVGGLGVVPGDRRIDARLAGAVGIRGYTQGDQHRGLLELSVSQLADQTIRTRAASGRLVQEDDPLYGPGLAVGYQFVAGSGFTAMISGGFGVAIAQDDRLDGSPVEPMANLGLGYTIP